MTSLYADSFSIYMNSLKNTWIAFLCCCLFFPLNGMAQILGSAPNDLPRFRPLHYICYKSKAPLKIDGKLDESSWQEAQFSQKFLDIEGTKKPQPLQETRVKMLWDDNYLYFAAELKETDLWATIEKRDSVIFYDNDFEIFIDPDGDTHNYYEFEVNALGTEWDLLLPKPYRDGGPAIDGWDIAGMKVGIQLNGSLNDNSDRDSSWVLEIAMPWNILEECAPEGKPPFHKDQWRINFSRVEYFLDKEGKTYKKRINPETGKTYPEFNWVWSPQGKINMHMPEMWGFVQFSREKVGEGFDQFQWNRDEDIKWALRQVYYKQKAFKEATQNYSRSLDQLGLGNMMLNGKKLTPYIEATSASFVASLGSSDGNGIWYIREDGKTWKK